MRGARREIGEDLRGDRRELRPGERKEERGKKRGENDMTDEGVEGGQIMR